MAAAYRDSVGNVLSQSAHVCVTRTGDIGRIVAIDRYKDLPLQVMFAPADGATRSKPVLRWFTGDCLTLCPDCDQVAGQTFVAGGRPNLPDLERLADQLLGPVEGE